MKLFCVILVVLIVLITKYTIEGHPTIENNQNQIPAIVSLSSTTQSHENNISSTLEENNIGTIIGNCLIQTEIIKCFKKRVVDRLQDAINDNETWHINEYLMIEKNPDWESYHSNNNTSSIENNLNDILTKKFEDLTESRSLRIKIVTPQTNSNEIEQGRKKKDKGGFALMGGIALAGMMAQLFMGKIVTMAGIALILSKLALLFSVLNALKKSHGSSEHVVYSGGGTGGHEGNWHRSIPRYNDEQYENHYQDETRL